MTIEELKALIESQIKEAMKDLTEENKKFIDEMEKTLDELKKPVGRNVTTEVDDSTYGFKNLGEFAHAVWKAPRKMDKRLIAYQGKAAGDGLTEVVDEEGGFLIPPEFSNKLLKVGVEKSDLYAKCFSVPVKTSSIKIPYIKDTDRSSGLIHGGVKLYWADEETQARIQLNLHKLIGLAYATDEVLADSPISLEPLLTEAFTDAFAWTMDYEILAGTGAGRPLGIKNAPCLVTVAKESGQSADTIVYENIVKMYSRMPAPYKKNAIWIANHDIFPQLATMKLAVGTGGSAVYLPAGGASGKPYDTLLGKPIIFTEHAETLGDKGDIYFVDLSQYILATKGGIESATSIHLKFDYDQTAFRFTYRVDGQPWWPSALTPRNSSQTLSPFVTLAARA